MWQGVGASGRVWGYVAGLVVGVGVCGRGSGLCHGHVAGEVTYGRVWRNVAGCEGMCSG